MTGVKDPDHIRTQFIEATGQTTQSLGLGRVIGQIFAHLYFCREPQTLDNLTETLGISKSSASTVVRQLEQWGALRKIWVKGDRKDYYEADDHIGQMVRRALLNTMVRRMEADDQFLEETQQALEGIPADTEPEHPDMAFVRQRTETLNTFRNRAKRIWESTILKLLVK